MRDVYPVTIICDRYGGTYSGAEWLAFNLDPEDVPKDVAGDDVECMMFWEQHRQDALSVGRGTTPDEALQDLYRKIPEEDR